MRFLRSVANFLLGALFVAGEIAAILLFVAALVFLTALALGVVT